MDPATKLPRKCVEVDVDLPDTGAAAYPAQSLVRFRKPVGMEPPELIQRIENCESEFIDWMFKEFTMSKVRVADYCASLRRFHAKKAK